MATTTITVPVVIKVENTDTVGKSFIPYRENFTSVLGVGNTLEFKATTSGQVLYYLKQNTDGLVITKQADFDEDSDALTKIEVPAIMTITNNSNVVKTFVPYKENFEVNVAAGDAYQIEATTLGQVLYYDAQKTDGLTVAYAKKV